MASSIRYALLFFLVLLGGGTLSYRLIEGWPLFDSFYMTVITLSTVGYGELHPLSPLGKIFTSALILLGVGTLAYVATRTTEEILERRPWLRRRIRMQIKNSSGHVIICGYGRMGKTVCDQLLARAIPSVVIEKDVEVCEELSARGVALLNGDATEDATLLQAGVERATALATVLPHDADNLLVTLTARSLNRELTIVTRSANDKNESKMLTAGATRVLNPYRSGGRLMARQLLHPTVTEFIDVISKGGEAELSLEEIQLQPGSSLAGVTLREAPIRREMDVIIVGVRRGDERLILNPPPEHALRAGEVLVALGRPENLRRLEHLAGEADDGAPD